MRSKYLKANLESSADLEKEVARIASLNKDDLRAFWRKTKGHGPPEALSKDLIARALAQVLQEACLGSLSPNLRKQLIGFANGQGENARYIKTGSVIVREYQGRLHEVVVVPDGFLWAGQTYRSLSTIALKITGTSWNGPRFFGLRCKRERHSRESKDATPTDTQLVEKAVPAARKSKNVNRIDGVVAL